MTTFDSVATVIVQYYELEIKFKIKAPTPMLYKRSLTEFLRYDINLITGLFFFGN